MEHLVRTAREDNPFDDNTYSYHDNDSHHSNGTTNQTTTNTLDNNFYHDVLYYDDDYYHDLYGGEEPTEFILAMFDFEKSVYLYFWTPMIILTTLTNIIVLLVLIKRRMRSATNMILIAIAVSDSMTGLVTVPGFIYAFNQGDSNSLHLTRDWCNSFMFLRYFVSRSFHTISIWLTVVLGIQRLVSVSYPFQAQTIFSMKRTMLAIGLVTLISPFLHIYHVFNSKTLVDTGLGFCDWDIESPCEETCAYFWLSVFLMHFVPCGLLVVCTISMIGQMKDAAKKMQEAKMITNQKNIERRNMESRRISCIVIVVVVVFLIPEIPYGVYLLVTAVYTQLSKDLVSRKTNRKIICAYEILLVITFQANFWIYVIMNRKFRRGLMLLLDPLLACLNVIFGQVGVNQIPRPRLDSTTSASGGKMPLPVNNSNTVHSRLSISNSFRGSILDRRGSAPDQRRFSRSSSGPKTPTGLEMRTYNFSFNNNQVADHEIEKIESEPELEHDDVVFV